MNSRSILFSRFLCNYLKKQQNIHINTPVRGSHVISYRVAPPPHSKATKIGAEVVGAAMWWWVLWHLWHEHEHITGEFPYPKTGSWTNAELGIPLDTP